MIDIEAAKARFYLMRQKQSARPYFIYALCDPNTKETRYIGYTYQPKVRLGQHIREARVAVTKNVRDEWICRLLADGKRPVLQILERTSNEYVEDRESYWYQRALKLGCDLTNTWHAIGNGQI